MSSPKTELARKVVQFEECIRAIKDGASLLLKAREASEGSTHDGLQAEIDAVRMRNTTILLKVKMLHSDILLLASDLCQPKDSKQLLQKLSLSLQSLLYEKSHFLKEIHTNRSFVSADTGIELVAKDAFLAKLEASKVGSDTVDQAKVCNTSSMNIDCDDNGTASLSYSSNATGSGFSSNESGDSNDSQLEKGKVDPHDLHLLRLADELTERKALLAEIERLKKRKRELNAINQEKTKQIERISSSVKMFYQSGKDIEKLFP